MRKTTFLLPIFVVIAAIALGLSSIFIVDEREKALVLQFGRVSRCQGRARVWPSRSRSFRKWCAMTTVSCRSMLQPLEVTPLDDRRLVVDAFARYRISPMCEQFRQAVGVGGIPVAEDRLDRSCAPKRVKFWVRSARRTS